MPERVGGFRLVLGDVGSASSEMRVKMFFNVKSLEVLSAYLYDVA